jgi:hypothetical protein
MNNYLIFYIIASLLIAFPIINWLADNVGEWKKKIRYTHLILVFLFPLSLLFILLIVIIALIIMCLDIPVYRRKE